MARVSALGSEYVVLVLTRREAKALHLLARDGWRRDPATGDLAAAGTRAIRALGRGVDLLVKR